MYELAEIILDYLSFNQDSYASRINCFSNHRLSCEKESLIYAIRHCPGNIEDHLIALLPIVNKAIEDNRYNPLKD